MTADISLVGTVCGMPYSSDLTDEQWTLLEPVFNAPGKRGPKHASDLRWSRRMRDNYRKLLEPTGVVPETIYRPLR